MIDLNQFVEWQKENNSCSVTIEVGKHPMTNEISVWVFDYVLLEGQHVKSVDEIDLQSIKDKKEKEKYKELKKKFGDSNA